MSTGADFWWAANVSGVRHRLDASRNREIHDQSAIDVWGGVCQMKLTMIHE